MLFYDYFIFYSPVVVCNFSCALTSQSASVVVAITIAIVVVAVVFTIVVVVVAAVVYAFLTATFHIPRASPRRVQSEIDTS